ncbi:MAG: class I SAM-dependent methyltransferase [Elusimicrobiota bacterium]
MTKNYIFEDHSNDAEYKRLKYLEEACDGSSQKLIEKTFIEKGWSCLEVGAGGGSILAWLGKKVGKKGLVVGLDKNTQYLNQFNVAPFNIVRGEIKDFKPQSSFDLIHARYVFIHNKDAIDLISHLAHYLNPKGFLILEEPNFETAQWLDPMFSGPCNKVNQAMLGMFRSMGLDPSFGEKMEEKIKSLGFKVFFHQELIHKDKGFSPVAIMMAKSAQALKEKYVATKKAAPADVDMYIMAAMQPASLAIYYSTHQLIVQKK